MSRQTEIPCDAERPETWTSMDPGERRFRTSSGDQGVSGHAARRQGVGTGGGSDVRMGSEGRMGEQKKVVAGLDREEDVGRKLVRVKPIGDEKEAGEWRCKLSSLADTPSGRSQGAASGASVCWPRPSSPPPPSCFDVAMLSISCLCSPVGRFVLAAWGRKKRRSVILTSSIARPGHN